MRRDVYIPRLSSVRGTLILIAMALALSMALALFTPAHGQTLSDSKGDINGQVTVNGQGTAGVTVELRQRTNGGTDATLASVATDGTGTYHFPNQPSAPNDAFFYIRILGGKNTLTAWYSFPIIYLMGSEVTAPAVEIGDVTLAEPSQNAVLALPGKVRWDARKVGETYRLFIYASGVNDKPVLDSGSLGTGTEYTISEGALAPGKYEGVVQVRDAIAGYGQSQSRFHFTVAGKQGENNAAPAPAAGNIGSGAATPQANTPPQVAPTQAAPQTQPQSVPNEQGVTAAVTPADAQDEQARAKPQIKVNLSADKSSAGKGDKITYKVQVENSGTGAAPSLVLTDKLPAGLVIDASSVTSTDGKVSVDSGTVRVEVGDMAPGAKTTIEIPAQIGPEVGKNLSNQASATYQGAADAVQSNAYIAEVAAPISGAAQQPVQQAPAAPAGGSNTAPAAPAGSSAAPSGGGSAAPAGGSNAAASAPKQAPPAAQPKAPANSGVAVPPRAAPGAGTAQKPAAPMPQTGGSFPVVLAVLLLLVILLARYLRGLSFRRT